MVDTTKLRALLAVATARPWHTDVWYGNDDGGWAAIGPHHMATEDEGCDDAPGSPAYDRAMADSALIAAAPELIAALCDEVERLRARKAEMCGCVNYAEPVANYTQDGCPKCGGSGAVIVEGEK